MKAIATFTAALVLLAIRGLIDTLTDHYAPGVYRDARDEEREEFR